MSEELRIIAEDLMLAFARPCLTPIGVKLLTGGITQHCCWDCHNCKTAEKQASQILSAQLATIATAVEELDMYEAYFDELIQTTNPENAVWIKRAEVLQAIEGAGK